MLTKRLEEVAQLVDHNQRVADIGTDHAYLPIMLVENHITDFVIASDIREGPVQNARANVLKSGLEKEIQIRKGPGLATITAADQVQTVVIAGMGGKLIRSILEDAKQAGLLFETLLLEANVGEPVVRQWLADNNYQIVSEKLVADDEHLYEIIKAQQSPKKITLTAAEQLFGPLLRQTKGPLFTQKWRKQLQFDHKLLAKINQATVVDAAKITAIETEISLIEKELADDQN